MVASGRLGARSLAGTLSRPTLDGFSEDFGNAVLAEPIRRRCRLVASSRRVFARFFRTFAFTAVFFQHEWSIESRARSRSTPVAAVPRYLIASLFIPRHGIGWQFGSPYRWIDIFACMVSFAAVLTLAI